MAVAVEVQAYETILDDEGPETEPLLSPGNNPMTHGGTFLPDLSSVLSSLQDNSADNVPQSSDDRSLFRMARTAKRASNGFFSFLNLFFVEVYWALTCNVVVSRVFVVIPLSMVAVGGIFWSECPAEPYIPIYLVAAGSAAVLSFVLVGTHSALCERDASTETVHEPPTCLIATELIVSTFQLAWFLAGCFWIYSIYEPKYNPPGNYCNQFVYLFAFWVNNVVWIILGAYVLCFCVLAICFWRI